MLNERKWKLLGYIIEEYVVSAEPVGSKFLTEKYNLGISSATVRNDMGELESEGFIEQPYTSAGRVPTIEGLKQYIEAAKKEPLNVTPAMIRSFTEALSGTLEPEARFKALAREVAGLVKNAVIIGFDQSSTYYTGLSYLFGQPEFNDQRTVCACMSAIDDLDSAVGTLFRIWKENDILYGTQNPFGVDTAIVGTRLKENSFFFGILGPRRMDYRKNFGIIEWIRENAGAVLPAGIK